MDYDITDETAMLEENQKAQETQGETETPGEEMCIRDRFWSILSGFYGISFGALCTIPYFFISGPAGAFAYWVSGVAYDIPHCIGNVALCLALFKPLRSLLEKMVFGNLEKPVHN